MWRRPELVAQSVGRVAPGADVPVTDADRHVVTVQQVEHFAKMRPQYERSTGRLAAKPDMTADRVLDPALAELTVEGYKRCLFRVRVNGKVVVLVFGGEPGFGRSPALVMFVKQHGSHAYWNVVVEEEPHGLSLVVA